MGLERHLRSLNARRSRRMLLWEAAMRAKNVDEAYRHLQAAVRLMRKSWAAENKMRLRGVWNRH